MSFKEIMKLLLKSLLTVLLGALIVCIGVVLITWVLTGHFILAILLATAVVFITELWVKLA